MGTKERIIEVAIDFFSEKGFNEVSIREITRAVGIKESSLYNHFASKQQILDEILAHLKRQFDAMTLPEEEAAKLLAVLSPEEFMQISMQNFNMYFGNPKLLKILRILSIERFKNSKANEMYNQRLIDEPLRYQAKVFEAMMDRGLMRRMDPMLLAREFYSPILLIYVRYIETDRSVNPAANAALKNLIQEHVVFISEIWQVKNKQP